MIKRLNLTVSHAGRSVVSRMLPPPRGAASQPEWGTWEAMLWSALLWATQDKGASFLGLGGYPGEAARSPSITCMRAHREPRVYLTPGLGSSSRNTPQESIPSVSGFLLLRKERNPESFYQLCFGLPLLQGSPLHPITYLVQDCSVPHHGLHCRCREASLLPKVTQQVNADA